MGARVAILSIAVLLAAGPVQAVTVYRCVDDEGAVAYQDQPCPPASEGQARRYEVPDSLPSAPPDRQAPAPAPESAAAVEAPPAPRPPPDPLWLCRRFDGDSYESTTGRGERRWVPLWVLGVDPHAPAVTFGDQVGGPRPSPPRPGPGAPANAGMGLAATPGAWVQDVCGRLTDAEACRRWDARRDELRRRWRLAQSSERERIRAEERPLSAMLSASCGR